MLQWVHRPGSPVAARDADAVSGLVQVGLYSGDLVILRASDGDVVLRWRAGGFPVVPRSP
ncbi:hypothetical protein LR393_32835 [Kineosporia mesophila]|nr:hypothetical protein [Kineosporia mesophila]MCD5354878.1 hypothetical protein [Kineosporia mesophila]